MSVESVSHRSEVKRFRGTINCGVVVDGYSSLNSGAYRYYQRCCVRNPITVLLTSKTRERKA